MKSLASLCYAALLIILLAISTMAGQVDCLAIVAPPPPSAMGQISSGGRSPGEMETPLMFPGEMQAGATLDGQMDCPGMALLLTLTLGVL
jgi:hypothetical protein